jgi:hypothetical protein
MSIRKLAWPIQTWTVGIAKSTEDSQAAIAHRSVSRIFTGVQFAGIHERYEGHFHSVNNECFTFIGVVEFEAWELD